MEALEPCPVCGRRTIVKKEDPYDGDYVAGCPYCGIWKRERTEEQAIEAWNKNFGQYSSRRSRMY